MPYPNGAKCAHAAKGETRCKDCKAKRNARLNHPTRERVETTATCSQCGKETTVPFRPTQGRPVYCKECFQARKAASL